MPRKKKKSLLVRIIVGIFKAIWFLIKGIFKMLFNFIGRKRGELKEKKKESSRPKVEANYERLKLLKGFDGSYGTFEDKLFNSPSLIGIILGARGSGKSAIGMKLLENVKAKTNRYVCAMGFKKENLPDWIHIINNIDEIPNGSLVLIDEAGIEFSAREAMSSANKLLSNLLLISRHKDLSILFISQNSSNLEVNAIRQADFLILKPSSLLQKDFERKKIKDIYVEVQDHFNEYKEIVGLTYIYSTEFRGFVSNNLPSFWSKEVSKSYSKA